MMARLKRLKTEESQTRNSSRSPNTAPDKLVETVNALSCDSFFDRYSRNRSRDDGKSKFMQANLTIKSFSAVNVPQDLLESCLKLIEDTSRDDYDKSDIKWSRSKKLKEMKLPDMKYIILEDPERKLAGFVSFMVTYEDGHEVVYIYEIHFPPAWQGRGLGKKLMHDVESIAEAVGVSKVMLTVFRSNSRAIDWYTKLGYVEDEFSPGPRKLRNGTVKESSYIILSKSVRQET
jgi:N-alpha-acetyltransferase 40